LNFTQGVAMQLEWALVLFTSAVGVFCIPLLPAFMEMRRKRPYVLAIDRQDDGSSAYAALKLTADAPVMGDLHIQSGHHMGTANCLGHLYVGHNASIDAAQAQHIFLHAGATVREVASAVQTVCVQADCQFTWLDAPTVSFVATDSQTETTEDAADVALAPTALALAGKREKFIRIQGSWHPEPQAQMHGDYVVTKDVDLAQGCEVFGSIKAYGNVKLGAYSRVHGSVFAEGAIEVSAATKVLGVVSAGQAVSLHGGSVVGHVSQLSSVSAPRIVAHAGAVVHGSVRASTLGRSTA
jgi:cytoskeletal protein CcmA (bactofilin family)